MAVQRRRKEASFLLLLFLGTIKTLFFFFLSPLFFSALLSLHFTASGLLSSSSSSSHGRDSSPPKPGPTDQEDKKKDKEEGSLRINNSPPPYSEGRRKGPYSLIFHTTIHYFFRGLEYTFLLFFPLFPLLNLHLPTRSFFCGSLCSVGQTNQRFNSPPPHPLLLPRRVAVEREKAGSSTKRPPFKTSKEESGFCSIRGGEGLQQREGDPIQSLPPAMPPSPSAGKNLSHVE